MKKNTPDLCQTSLNELCEIFKAVKSGDTVQLKNKVYDVYPEDSFHLTGYYFSNTASKAENPNGERYTALFLEDKNSVSIFGNGAVIRVHGIMTPFLFRNCKNLAVSDLTFDYVRPPMSEFTVIFSQRGEADIKINDDCRFRLDDEKTLVWLGEDDFSGKPYWEYPYKGEKMYTSVYTPDDGEIHWYKHPEDVRPALPTVKSFRIDGKNLLHLTFEDKNLLLPEGAVFATRNILRNQIGGAVDDGNNILLQNLTIRAINGFGLLFQNAGNVKLKGLDCTPKEGRTMVSNADFFHFSGCRGKITVKNCKACGAHDDFINIHGTFLRIVDVNREEKSVTVRFMHGETWGITMYYPLDHVQFVNASTLVPYYKTSVIRANKLNDTEIRVFLRDEIPELMTDKDVLENITACPKALIEGNEFSRSLARGILCTSGKEVIIRDNHFVNISLPVLYVSDDANYWYESGATSRIVFENNLIDNAANEGAAVITYNPVVENPASLQAVHGTFILKDNCFIHSPDNRYVIKTAYLNKAEITGNRFDAPFDIQADKTEKVIEMNNMVKE